jgi:hypothetical protein
MSTSRYVFEANGGALLCATGRLRPDEVPSLLEAIDGFASHVPAVVGSLYPAGPSEARA